jgi:hypothetical protein
MKQQPCSYCSVVTTRPFCESCHERLPVPAKKAVRNLLRIDARHTAAAIGRLALQQLDVLLPPMGGGVRLMRGGA